MADIEYTEDVYPGDGFTDPETAAPDPATAGGGTLTRALSVAGAVASLALVIGVGVWGYRLMVRDVSGVPVVRAIEGPMRVQPKDPGGQPADHQGLAVNAVAAQGVAAPTPDRLLLAPRPVELAEEDAPMGTLAPVPVSLPAAQGETPAPEARTDAVEQFREGSVDALVRELTQDVAPMAEAAENVGETPPDGETDLAAISPETLTLPVAEAETLPEPEVKPAIVTGPGLARSLRPVARPERVVATAASPGAAPAAPADAAAVLDVDPDSLPVGTRLAQLGAYDSPEVARTEWDRLQTRFEDYLDGKQRVIQKASSGGRTFYRLRAMGFQDLSDARRFCSALVAENADCIPVTTR